MAPIKRTLKGQLNGLQHSKKKKLSVNDRQEEVSDKRYSWLELDHQIFL